MTRYSVQPIDQIFDHAKQSATYALKTASKRTI